MAITLFSSGCGGNDSASRGSNSEATQPTGASSRPADSVSNSDSSASPAEDGFDDGSQNSTSDDYGDTDTEPTSPTSSKSLPSNERTDGLSPEVIARKEGGLLRTLADGAFSSARPSHNRVVFAHNPSEFNALIAKLPIRDRTDVQQPENFSDHMVVGIFLKPQRGAETVFLHWMTRHGGEVEVVARKRMAGRGCDAHKITMYPYIIAETQRLVGKPKLIVRAHTLGC